jgi:outer membrane immunogenic protein
MSGRRLAPVGALLLAMALAGCAVVRDTRTGNIYEVGPGHVFKPYEQVLDRYEPYGGGGSFAALGGPRWVAEFGGVYADGGMRHPFAPAATDAWGGGVTAGIGAETGCYFIPGTETCLRIGGFVNVTSLSAESPPNFGLEISRFRVPAVLSARATAYVPVPNTSLQIFGGLGPAVAYRSGSFGGQSDNGWSLGWQLTGGLEYATSPYSKIRLAYTFTDLNPLSYDFPAGRVKVNTDLHAFTLGYTRSFGSGFAFDAYDPRPNTYQPGTGRWISGFDYSYSRTHAEGPDFTASGNGASAGVFGGYHHAVNYDPNRGMITWLRLEGGITAGDFATDRPGVYHGNIGPIVSVRPGISWQFLGTPTRPDICVFVLGGIAGARVEDHFVGATDSSTKVGWEVGAGLEFALSKNWAARISYTHTDLGSTEVLGTKFEHKVDRVGIGLLYRTVPVM